MDKKTPPVYYSTYLQLDKILEAQDMQSAKAGRAAHDEMLFIIVHQVYELWFKQIIHELDGLLGLFGQEYVDEKDVGTAVSRLSRITEIQKLLIDQIHILETMTPLDFLEFRGYLSPASGFQSVQFRIIENKLGLPPEQRVKFDKNLYYAHVNKAHQAQIRAAEAGPNLFKLVEKWLERTPFLSFGKFDFWRNYRRAVEKLLEADREVILKNQALSAEEKEKQLQEIMRNEEQFAALFDEHSYNALLEKGRRRLSHRATQAALLIHLYRDEPILHLPFRLLTLLVDVDELLTSWRYRHALMVQRMIGTKLGTGGSVGFQYLRSTLDKHKVFLDLANLATFLIPRSALPVLPEEVQASLGFYYSKARGTKMTRS